MRDDARPKCEGATSSNPFDTIHLNTIALAVMLGRKVFFGGLHCWTSPPR